MPNNTFFRERMNERKIERKKKKKQDATFKPLN